MKPFAAWDGKELIEMPLLLKAEGKCTTDHISMAGPWLRFRGHLENISDNMLMGAVNAFNGKTNSILNQLNGKYEAVSAVAKQYKAKEMCIRDSPIPIPTNHSIILCKNGYKIGKTGWFSLLGKVL